MTAWLILGFLSLFLVVAIVLRNRLPYLMNLWYATDLWMSALLAGDPSETMSSRLGKAARRGSRFARFICKGLSLIDAYHCEDAINEELGEKQVPVAMMIVCLVWIVVVALAVFGCEPGRNPVGVGLPDELSGRVVHQFTGEPVAGVKVAYRQATAFTDTDGRFVVAGIDGGSRIQFKSGGIIPRRAYVNDGDSVWKVVPTGFDTLAYNDIGRSFSLKGTVRWAVTPTIYVDTRRHCFTGGDPATWAAESKVQAQQFVREWTAGVVQPTVVVTSSPPADFTPGTIVVHFSECSVHLGAFIGYARLSWNTANHIGAATVYARFKKYANDPNKRQGILGHELGHTLGYSHMFAPVSSLMQPSLGSKTALKPFDHLAAQFLYGRVSKNKQPDQDASNSESLTLASGGYWEGW